MKIMWSFHFAAIFFNSLKRAAQLSNSVSFHGQTMLNVLAQIHEPFWEYICFIFFNPPHLYPTKHKYYMKLFEGWEKAKVILCLECPWGLMLLTLICWMFIVKYYWGIRIGILLITKKATNNVTNNRSTKVKKNKDN